MKSKPLPIRQWSTRCRTTLQGQEENVAQDVITQDVARVLAFDATRQLTVANDQGGPTSAITLGHVEYGQYAQRYARWLASLGHLDGARGAMERPARPLPGAR
jgi:hypothetical protein